MALSISGTGPVVIHPISSFCLCTLHDGIFERAKDNFHLKIGSPVFKPKKRPPSAQVFHGIAPDPLEIQMEAEPEFCRDVLETRIKMVFREHLRISRDMPLTQVRKYRQPSTFDSPFESFSLLRTTELNFPDKI